jgi:hypothetical protein
MRTQTSLPVLALALASAAMCPHRALAAAPNTSAPTRTQGVASASFPLSLTQPLVLRHSTARIAHRPGGLHHPRWSRVPRTHVHRPHRAPARVHPAAAAARHPSRPRLQTAAAAGGPTSWPALNQAIARIPTRSETAARWVVASPYGHWGTTDWYHDVIYISPSVPLSLLYSVAVHEWSHVLSVHVYGSVPTTVQALDLAFGAAGMNGAELAADCMARLQGATWTGYTSCARTDWREMSQRLLSGRPAKPSVVR